VRWLFSQALTLPRLPATIACIAGAVILAALVVAASSRTRVWETASTLLEDAADPSEFVAYLNLEAALEKNGDYPQAFAKL